MKSVLASIKPRYCELIAIGQKTLEIRKSRPKLETPFKCYIYQTKKKWWYKLLEPFRSFAWAEALRTGQRKVVGEFICYHIYQYTTSNCTEGMDITTEEVTRMSCLTYEELRDYELSAEPKENRIYLVGLYCWHISDLKIYDEPKALSAFCFPSEKFCEPGLCGGCPKYEMPDEYGDVMFDCEWKRPIMRPPQSWCYVEAL